MTRRTLAFALLALALFGSLSTARAADRPNILWVVSEDNSVFLGCYGYEDANTPRLDQLAGEGIRYTHAFSNAPVCAPARCTIITGVYPPSMGTQHMRSKNRIPDHIKMFPKYLRAAGYYCTNNSKTDYNLSYGKGGYDATAWDKMTKGDHTKRKPGQPFFAVYNIGTSHESSLHKPLDKSLFDADVTIPPYHPDVPEVRANWAMYHRIITRMDGQVGAILDKLEKEGVADDTIVFYYGDHGGILTRSKRFLYDTGTHIPMLVRFGKNWQHLAPGKPGSTSDRLVSFIDLAPTVLSLAGVEVPEHVQGHAFLGEQKTEDPEYVHLFRGRMDERYDFSRAVRDHRFKYIRNYMPHRIWGQHLNYLWKMPLTNAWQREYEAGRTTGPQNFFWEPKPAEELYDTEADYWEVKNLAGDPAYAADLARLRKALDDHQARIHDSGFLPEGQFNLRSKDRTTYELVRDADEYPLAEVKAMAETATGPKASATDLRNGLTNPDPGVRYWAATGCIVHLAVARELSELLVNQLSAETDPDTRLAVAEALCRIDQTEDALPEITKLLEHENEYVALHAANVLEEIGDAAKAAVPAMKKAAKRGGYVQRATEYTVERLGE